MVDSCSVYDIHVFCCTNQRHVGHPRGCCADKGSVDLRDYLKKRGKEFKIKGLRVNTAGCLDRCELGPVMVIYPDGTWYHYRTEADLDEILHTHLVGGGRVQRLLLQPGQTQLNKRQLGVADAPLPASEV